MAATNECGGWRWNERIPMRDGQTLAATIYFPQTCDGRFPVLFTLTPYTAQRYHDDGLFFVAEGFVALTIDCRGRGNSGGKFRPFDSDATDATDVINWLMAQPYCNGKVAMWGGSYSGHNQWMTAARTPQKLTTIIPVASPHIGTDFPMRNNIWWPYIMQWLTIVRGKTLQDRIFADTVFWSQRFVQWLNSGNAFLDLDLHCGGRSEIFQEWMQNPIQSTYWDQFNPRGEDYTRISLPVLSITGFYDGDQLGTLTHYRLHQLHGKKAADQHYLVIGPWDHAATRAPRAEIGGVAFGEASLVDLKRLHADWYKWTMCGAGKPEFLRGRVAYYVTAAEYWRFSETLDDVTDHYQPLYLSGCGDRNDVFRAGLLNPVVEQTSKASTFVYDPLDLSTGAFDGNIDTYSLTDQRAMHAAVGKSLFYHSYPFEEDVELSGFFKLSLWVTIDQPDTDFRASIFALTAEGRCLLLTSDSVRARHRNSLRENAPVPANEAIRYEFNTFNFVSRAFKRGDRLRLMIGPNASIYRQRNYNSGGDVSMETASVGQSVVVGVLQGKEYPSHLEIPIARTWSDY